MTNSQICRGKGKRQSGSYCVWLWWRYSKIALQNKGDGYIEILCIYEMWDRPVCWRTVGEVKTQYGQLCSKTAQLHLVKQKLLIRSLVLGWEEALGLGYEEARHLWSENGVDYSPDYLFKSRMILRRLQEKIHSISLNRSGQDLVLKTAKWR